MSKYRILSSLVILGLLFSAATAEDKPESKKKKKINYTTIQVKNMHCLNCAKKIAAKLYKVKGVKEVRADVKTHRAYIVPLNEKQKLSPYAMWLAVEQSGFKPVKMWGPQGSFSKKPPKPLRTANAGNGTVKK